MELHFPMIVFSLVLLLLLPIMLLFIGKHKSLNSKLPPGPDGWPILGENIAFFQSGPRKYVNDKMKMYSNKVFRTSLLGEKLAVFCGPEGNKFLFSNPNKLVTPWWPSSLDKILLVGSSTLNSKKEFTKLHRALVIDPLRIDSIKKFIPVMDSIARQQIESDWIPFGEVKVYPLVRKYAFTLACKLFIGIHDHKEIKRLADPFHMALKGIISPVLDFPGTVYYRARRAGEVLRGEIMRIIKERKKQVTINDVKDDVLSRSVLATDENGKFMSELEITRIIVGLLLASNDPTTAAITFVLKYLAKYPHIYDMVYNEQMEILKSKCPKDSLNWEDLQNMKYTWRVACETMRLAPPTQGAFREAINDFTYEGYNIPKGWKIHWTVHSTHRDPTYFPNPENFDASRFEGSGPTPYTFVPFGGGARMCPGKEYSRLLVLIFIHNVVTRFKFEELKPDEEILYYASPVLKDGFPIRIKQHAK